MPDKVLKWRGYQGEAKASIDPAPILELLGDDPEAALAASADFVKDKLDKGSRVYRARLDLGRGEDEEIFLKTINATLTAKVLAQRGLTADGLKRPHHYPVKITKLGWAPSGALRAWRVEAACVKAGVPVAEHLLYLRKGLGLLRREVVVTKGVEPRSAPNARVYFQSTLQPPNPTPERRALRRQLITDLGVLLHQVRVSNIMFPDLKLHNLIVEESPGQKPRLVMIDLVEAVPNQPRYPEATLLRRFAIRLPGFSTTEKIRLAKAYLEAGSDQRSWSEISEVIGGCD